MGHTGVIEEQREVVHALPSLSPPPASTHTHAHSISLSLTHTHSLSLTHIHTHKHTHYNSPESPYNLIISYKNCPWCNAGYVNICKRVHKTAYVDTDMYRVSTLASDIAHQGRIYCLCWQNNLRNNLRICFVWTQNMEGVFCFLSHTPGLNRLSSCLWTKLLMKFDYKTTHFNHKSAVILSPKEVQDILNWGKTTKKQNVD